MVSFRVSKEENYALRDNRSAQTQSSVKDTNKKTAVENGSIFAGDTALEQDSIFQKKMQAGKEAMKGVMKQYQSDCKIEDDLKERSQHIESLQEDMSGANEKMQELKAEKEKLKEKYGITDNMAAPDVKELTPEREAYEEVVKGYDAIINHYGDMIEEAKNDIQSETEVIKSTKDAVLAAEVDMEDATRLAKEIKKAASKEIAGMLLQEGKEHVDEEMKKSQEEAEKKAEEKRTVEEAIAAAEERKRTAEEQIAAMQEKIEKQIAEMPALIDASKVSEELEKMQQEINAIMEKNKFLTEDMKGIAVDKLG